MELYAPRHCATVASLDGDGSTAHELYVQVTACGADEDTVSMALSAMHRLTCCHRVGWRDVGKVCVASAFVMDRSKSVKTELVALLEAEGSTDVEGVDSGGGCHAGVGALRCCLSWVGSASWDGRWSVVVCSDAPTWSSHCAGAAAVAVLVGPRPCSHTMRGPPHNLLRCTPRLGANACEPLFAATQMRAGEVVSRSADEALLGASLARLSGGTLCQAPAQHRIERRTALSLRLSARLGETQTTAQFIELLSSLLPDSVWPSAHTSTFAPRVALAHLPRYAVPGVAVDAMLLARLDARVLHDADRFQALRRQFFNGQGRFGWVPQAASAAPGHTYTLTASTSPQPDGKAWRTYQLNARTALDYVPRSLLALTSTSEAVEGVQGAEVEAGVIVDEADPRAVVLEVVEHLIPGVLTAPLPAYAPLHGIDQPPACCSHRRLR